MSFKTRMYIVLSYLRDENEHSPDEVVTAGKVPAIFNSVWIFGNIISLQAFNASIAVDGSESEPLEVTETDIHFRFHSSSSASTMFAELTLSKGMRPHLPHPPP